MESFFSHWAERSKLAIIMSTHALQTLTFPIIVCLLILSLSDVSPGWAQGKGSTAGKATEILTLDQAINLALEQSPDMEATRRRLEAANALVTQAEAGFYPKINFGEQYTDTNNPVGAFMSVLNQRRFDFGLDFNNPDPTDNFNTKLSLTQPLFNGGRTVIGRRIAQTNVARMSEELRRVHNDLRFEVTQAYFVILQAQELVKVQRESVTQVEAQLKIAQARFQAGTAVLSDVLNVEVRLAEVQEELIKAENRFALAQAAFNTVLGVEIEREFLLSPESQLPPLEKTLEEVLTTSLERRPEVASIQRGVKINEEQVKLAQAGFLPTLNLVVSYDLDTEDFSAVEESWQVGVVFQINLFDGFATTAKVRESRQNLEESKALERRVKLNIQLEAKEAFLNLQEARDRVQVATKSVQQAEESLRIIEIRYRGEIALVTELIDAQVALTAARTRLVTALFAEQIALARLQRAIGGLTR
jgi:TolC family type I secretion outer membrane protein